MPGADRDLVKVWEKRERAALRQDHAEDASTTAVEAQARRLWVDVRGPSAPPEPQLYDMVLVRRRPRARTAGRSPPTRPASPSTSAASSRSTRRCAPTCRTSSPSATSSASRCSRTRRCTRATSPPRPPPAQKSLLRRARDSVGRLHRPRDRLGRPHRGRGEGEGHRRRARALFPWAASGRAIANGRDEGFTKLLFDATTHRIVGGGIVGTHAGDLIGEIALAIEMGADAVDIGHTIHPHPTLGESVGLAAEAAEGVCTDLPPARKK